MDSVLIFQMVVAALLAAAAYTVIGIAPGTDETATIAPVTLVLVLSGLPPAVILSFFISAIVASKLTDSIPVAVAGIPGGVMATPAVEHAMILKKFGMSDVSIRKMASGSVIGTIVAVPVSLLLANALIPVADVIKEYANPLFFIGAIFLALMCKNRWIALASIVPFALLIQGLRYLYWGVGVVPEGTNVFVSFFLGITIGPIILTLFELLNKQKRESLERFDKKTIMINKASRTKGFPNPFTILSKRELGMSALSSLIGSITFIMSPVGMTIFLGEMFSSREKDPVKKASLAISCMEALANATYIAGTLIPLIALGIPLSPMAIGPANALFNAPPRFTLEHNMHHLLSSSAFVWATLIGAGIAVGITYFITIKYSQQICAFVFRRIPHEAILGLFFSLVLLLAFMDAGWINIGGVILIGLVAGVLHRWGINYGVQFMVLYSAPWIITNIVG
ncbi:tripartite tricarboxylate transporter permease [Neobacillus sp. MM2021_6]|uniref:tripartite tricarboxylate transporter permease n=1 Tax=Bacillaceae TaxID=186817 RepID=UPI00140E29F2|nr:MULTISPECIES: tripartite tricarboxylate transporter permease [Bacillaceae]MBO0961401.1 tripartite tricarboxylate transporter permease [Neobacillus sp. MM2021_6]NHC20442.1 tripartite tricarboxylate transporter permease [Bacillus sp. MM2020_4]